MNTCWYSESEFINDFRRILIAAGEITENVKLAKETGGGKGLI